ncbi:MAG: SDR family NAD(P)-dependent oxidoreductase, partial [Bacteroidota bacterium]|nr:SDR family NAD(P)-dependent oxidoreductase [Bacteroidota bacterium]
MGKRSVLITGATAGIGAACATTLATNGYDVILTGRRENRLAALKEEITNLYNINCTTLAFDIQDRKATLEAINSLPDSCAIDAVINNAGLALGKGPFQE